MGDVTIPQDRDERYARITLHSPSAGLLYDNGVALEDLYETLTYHVGLGCTVEKVEIVHVVTTVRVTELTPEILKRAIVKRNRRERWAWMTGK